MTVLHRLSSPRRPGGPIADGGHEDRGPEGFHLQYEPDTRSVAASIVEAVAYVHNVDHEELEPLGEVVDTDSLEDLVGPRSHAETAVEISFSYAGLHVTVNNDGDIWLEWA
jgi:hypothetical protein